MTEEEFLIKLGEKIASLRKKKKMSQREFALECDIEKSNLIRLEKGRTNPTTKTLLRISKALSVSIKRLFEFAD